MSLPWMPFYPADYLADTMHLSTLEHGAYVLLIMHYWQNGGLPDDEKKLTRICRVTPPEWTEIRDTLAEFFDDGWRHKRIDKELIEASTKHSKLSQAGREGGKKSAETRKNRKPSASVASSDDGSEASIHPSSPASSPASINASSVAGSIAVSHASTTASSDDGSNHNHHLSYPGSGVDLSGLAQDEDPFPTGLDRPPLGPIALAAIASNRGGRR